ncbi:MAG: hypothetical protein NTY53_14850 [Kiritimatiellaeota bacterium]|nr:hypothetical protein [Kiritimatiellota bacterium]
MKNMSHLLHLVTFVVVLSALVVAGGGCKPKAAGACKLTASVGARQVVAHLDGPGSIQPEVDKALIHSSAGVIAVWQDRVLLDGVEVAKLSKTVTNIEVLLSAGVLTVNADGQVVVTKPIKK